MNEEEFKIAKSVLKQGYVYINNWDCYSVTKVYKVYALLDKCDELHYIMETGKGDYYLAEMGATWVLTKPNDVGDEHSFTKSEVETLFTDILESNIELTHIDYDFAKSRYTVYGDVEDTPLWRLAAMLVNKGWTKK